MLPDLARLAWQSVRERAGRSALAAMGVFVAFLALAVALSVGEMAKSAVESAFQQLGLNTVWVMAQRGYFTEADAATAAAVAKEGVVIPIAQDFGVLRLPDGTERAVTVYYIPPQYLGLLLPKEALRSGQLYVGGPLVMVNSRVRMAGDRPAAPGSPMTLTKSDGSVVEVVAAGTFESTGFIGGADVLADNALYPERRYIILYIAARSPQAAEALAQALRPYFPDAVVITPQTLARQVGQLVSVVQVGLGVLAGISSLVTAMWLYDTVTISILQRTREIGIMRAVGFKRRHVIAMLLLETFIVMGIGVVAALPVLAAASAIPISLGPGLYLKLAISPVAVGAATAVVIGANILGVLPPAYRASRLNIVDALRYE